jgi:hypothetical protein
LAELDYNIVRHKSIFIDEMLARYAIKSIVDLGGCWGVNGGYSFYALEKGELERAVIVDGNITHLTRERAAAWPQLELIEGALGDEEIVKRVGKVDAAIMFDILLHQVSPDWDEFLQRYSHIDTLVINNQNWLGPETIRFPDFDVDEYVSRVLHSSESRVREWYRQHGEFNEEQGKPWRDVHNFWQWGITLKDLVRVLWDLGYRVDYLLNKGMFYPRFPEIETVALIARKGHLPHPRTEFPAAPQAPAPPADAASSPAANAAANVSPRSPRQAGIVGTTWTSLAGAAVARSKAIRAAGQARRFVARKLRQFRQR